MLFITGKYEWIPLYAIIIFFIIKQFGWRSITVLLAIALVITLSDQLASGLFKPFFQRLRPCHEPALQALVHLPGKCGGKYGFASSHASNTFGLAVFLVLLWRNKSPWIYLFLLWAAVVAYSRIYVGVHYPADILVGAILGVIAAKLVFTLWQKLPPKFNRPL